MWHRVVRSILARTRHRILPSNFLPGRCYATNPEDSNKSDHIQLPRGRKAINYPVKCVVAIVGIGGVGKSLAHLLKMYPRCLTELRLCNRSDPEGMVEELKHIPTMVKVTGFHGADELGEGLKDADVVVISAGVPRKPGMTRNMLFNENAEICTYTVGKCAQFCPKAMIAMVTNPLDSMVPIAAEVLKKHGVYKPQKLIGVCQIDQMRAQRFYAEAIGAMPRKTYVPVVGGHSENTTVPLFTKARPYVRLPEEEMMQLVKIVRTAGSRIVEARKSGGGSTYSMASATMFFVHKLCRALHHEPHLVVSGYVRSKMPFCPFFSNECLLGPDGIEENLGFGDISGFEKQLVFGAITHLQTDITKGIEYVAQNYQI